MVIHDEQVELVVNEFSMHLVHGSSYHPESQGAVESGNKLFKVGQSECFSCERSGSDCWTKSWHSASFP